jgi:hypothetical protein
MNYTSAMLDIERLDALAHADFLRLGGTDLNRRPCVVLVVGVQVSPTSWKSLYGRSSALPTGSALVNDS